MPNKFNKRPTLQTEVVCNVDDYGFLYTEKPTNPSIQEDQIRSTILNAMHNKIVENVDRQQFSDELRRLFVNLGIAHPANLYVLDVGDVKQITIDMGRVDQIRNNTHRNNLNMLRLGVGLSIQTDELGTPSIHTFMESKSGWHSKSPIIKIKDHMQDALECPACHTVYNDPNDILLAQTVSHCRYDVHLEKMDEVIKMMKPHIVLTPICPSCYCDALKRGSHDAINQSSVVTAPDAERQIVPLLPRCLVSKLETPNNKNQRIHPLLFWPKSPKDIICTTVKKMYKQILKTTRRNNDNTQAEH